MMPTHLYELIMTIKLTARIEVWDHQEIPVLGESQTAHTQLGAPQSGRMGALSAKLLLQSPPALGGSNGSNFKDDIFGHAIAVAPRCSPERADVHRNLPSSTKR